MADHDHDPTQYNPRWQALKETYFDWRCIVCCMVALSPQNLENQHIPGTESVYFDLDNTPWVKCDKCHTPFHLQCGTWESLQVVRNKRFLCTFFLLQTVLDLLFYVYQLICHPLLMYVHLDYVVYHLLYYVVYRLLYYVVYRLL